MDTNTRLVRLRIREEGKELTSDGFTNKIEESTGLVAVIDAATTLRTDGGGIDICRHTLDVGALNGKVDSTGPTG